MSHHADALTILALADAASVRAFEAAQAEPDDPIAALPGLVGALVHIFAAQVHATLAVAEALSAHAITPTQQ